MSVLVILVICFLPLIALLAICRFAAKVKLSALFIAALLGVIAVLPIVFVQFFVGDLRILNEHSYASELVRAIVLNGMVEEMWKAAVLFVLPVRRMILRDFFACALVTGLALGCFENAVYFLRSLQTANTVGATLLYAPIFTRLVTADMIHLFCTGLCGLFVFAARHHKTEIAALVFAVLTHGLYNFFAMHTTGIRFFAVAAILFAAIECRVRYVKVTEKNSTA